jgi:hypothetical protein
MLYMSRMNSTSYREMGRAEHPVQFARSRPDFVIVFDIIGGVVRGGTNEGETVCGADGIFAMLRAAQVVRA